MKILPTDYKEQTVKKIYKLKHAKKKLYHVYLEEEQLLQLKTLQDEIQNAGYSIRISEIVRTAISEHITKTKKKLHYDPNHAHYFGKNS